MKRTIQDELISPFVHSMKRKYGWRNPLYSEEDIAQEASIVLWRVLLEYPSKKEDELVKLFKKSFYHRLMSMFRPQYVRYSTGNVSLDVRIDLADSPYLSSVGLTPWNFYEVSLKRLEKAIGKANLKKLIHQKRNGMRKASLEKKKEEIMKYL